MHLIINPSDIYYLTGVSSHDPGEILIVSSDEHSAQNRGFVFCDLRTSALFEVEKFTIIDQRAEWAKSMSQFKMLETDPDYLTQSLREKIEGFGIILTIKKSPITQKRTIKTEDEITKLRESQKRNNLVYNQILPHLHLGVPEEEVARKIQILQLEAGATGSSFPPIVAFGENSAVPHHSPTKRKLQSTDAILLDMGLVYQGYCSDMTRMVYQKSISHEARKIGELVTSVAHEVIGWAKPGMKMSELDTKTRELLGEYEKYFTHSLGHGVGIDIHEAPHVSSKSDEVLVSGMIITIEPGIYIADRYGARYEEMCVVSEKGLTVL